MKNPDQTGMHKLPQASQWIRAILRYRSEHPALLRVLDIVERLQDRPYRANSLLLGEPGTGKEGLARALHALMHVEDAPFIEVAIGGRGPRETADELFGRGDAPGLIEHANGGTLYIDEVATLSREIQARLLAAIRGRVRREGDSVERTVHVTIVASTDHDLLRAVKDGGFRHDLYWRLARIVLTLPPLRERRSDIARLAVWIGSRILEKSGSPKRLALEEDREPGTVVMSREAAETLCQYEWPGNFRELDAVLERAMLLYSDGKRLTRENIDAALMRPDGGPA